MAQIKITSRRAYIPGYSGRRLKNRKARPGECAMCGTTLKSERSKKVGLGRVCNCKLPVIIVLDIPAASDG